MIEILIKSNKDNKFHRAILPDGFELNLTIENPYLTKSSEYSSEIELPLKGCRNNLILFGHLNRLDVTRRKEIMDAMLIVNYKKIVIGSITILECNDENVKIQLLGNNASVNFKNNFDNLFIDQLDLGSVFDNINPKLPYQDNTGNKTINVVDLDSFKKYLAIYSSNNRPIIGLNPNVYGDTTDGFVIFPAIDDEGNEVNKRTYIFWRESNTVSGWRYLKREAVTWPGIMAHFDTTGTPPTINTNIINGFYGAIKHGTTDYYKGIICPQPYIVSVIRRIIKAIGFEIERDDINTSDFKYCYIPSTTETVLINEMLPHWSVNDFLTEVENFFGIIFLFDEGKKICNIINKKEYYIKGNATYLNKIEDKFETTFDDENQIDVSSANISFSLDDSLHNLSESIEKNAITINLDSYSINSILDAINREDSVLFGENINKIIATRLGRQFIKYRDKACECNELRDYKIDDSDGEITLKIKPALLDYSKVTIIDGPINGNNEVYDNWSETYGYMTPKKWPAPICPRFGAWTTDLNITEAIDYGYNIKNKPDFLPLAIVKKEDWVNFKIKNSYIGIDEEINSVVYWGSTYGGDNISDMNLSENNVALRLNPTEGMITLYNQSIDVGVKIRGQVITRVSIYDKEIPELDKIFVFNGKRYICQKIEYKIDNNGINPQKTGYFFEMQ